MSLVHAFIGLSAYPSVCVCLSLRYLFISFYYGFIPDSNKWNRLDWIGM